MTVRAGEGSFTTVRSNAVTVASSTVKIGNRNDAVITVADKKALACGITFDRTSLKATGSLTIQGGALKVLSS